MNSRSSKGSGTRILRPTFHGHHGLRFIKHKEKEVNTLVKGIEQKILIFLVHPGEDYEREQGENSTVIGAAPQRHLFTGFLKFVTVAK